ncbi:MAG: beta-ketoacyl synthase chain length factor, partial [Caulobacteraceae bacterium]|nr:beta-ketoacyl synthase chain length factor [Caulobacteraceae bacterium]
PPPRTPILSPTKRRRAGLSVRLALAVALEASEMAGFAAGAIRSVFATSNGDGPVVHAILETLAGPDRQVSPTQFHNSVHNAAAGYWSIGAGSQLPALCLGCHDATFAAGLLKAGCEALVEGGPVLLCVYDAPLPPPLDALRPTSGAFGVALVVAPEESEGALARLSLRYAAQAAEPARSEPLAAGLRALAMRNPAARSLRLLESLARSEPGALQAELLDGRMEIEVEPCRAGRAFTS